MLYTPAHLIGIVSENEKDATDARPSKSADNSLDEGFAIDGEQCLRTPHAARFTGR
jgi:hypothetical protein